MPDYPIQDFGAVADLSVNSAVAIQRAIDAAHAAGGGRVVVPAGQSFMAGTLELKSRTTLHLEEGSVLLGSPNLADYSERVWGHHDDITPWHFILAEDCEQVAITGRGTLRGNGPTFWHKERRHEWAFFEEFESKRPSPMVEIVRCRHVLVEGVRIEESPGWTLHGHDCDYMRIQGITIRNSYFGPNTDGIDLTGCQDVIIHGCDIATGDDAIALKTNEFSRAVERVTISDCILRTSCLGIRIGYESREDFRDITVTNCVIPRCTRVIDIRAIEGATIERIRISNIVAYTNGGWPATRVIEVVKLDRPNVYKNLLAPIHPHYGLDRPLTRESRIRDISFDGMDIVTDGKVTVIGLPGRPVEDIQFRNIRLRYPVLDDARPFREAQSTSFIPGDFAEARSANASFVVQHARDVEIDGLRLHWPEFPVGDWLIFQSESRKLSPFWNGNEEAIRKGEHRVPYHILWARDAEVAIRGKDLSASEPGHPEVDADASCSVQLENR